MGIDYEGLYAHDYFGHQPGARSFRDEFPAQLAAIARALGCEGVLDVGSGNGELVGKLRALGLSGVPLDLRGDDLAGVLPFDLTGHEPAENARLQAESSRRRSGAAHLTTCLDVLEHIDRENLAHALWNLGDLTGEWLLVSVSTRPSSRDNLYHATVLPRRTWRRLFEAAGFEVVAHPGLDGMPYFLDYPDDEKFWCMNQWRRIDPFGDTRGTEPYYLLLRKSAPGPAHEVVEARFGSILLLRATGPGSRPALDPDTHLTFLVGHYQDFHHYRPYWDALDRSSVTVLIRGGPLRAIDPGRFRAILAYLRSRGLRHRVVQSVREVAWDEGPGRRRALVAATESTIIDTHLLNAAFVLAARGAGYRTFQIQHGIWPHADFSEPVAFTSEHVLTWSDEFRDGFAGHVPGAGGTTRPRGLIGSTRFTKTGCAKFDENADTRPITPADLLGDWAEAYSRTLLVATNLQWSQHVRGPEVMPALIDLARRHPETLLLCKLHPVHDVDAGALSELPPNLRVLDEFACLFGELQTPRLIRAADAVLCTPSTVALEASLAVRPFAVIDTGNPNRFEGVDPVPIAALGDEFERLMAPESRAVAIARHESFGDHYFDRSLLGQGLNKVIEAIEADLSDHAPAGLDPPTFAARAFAASFSEQYQAGGRDRVTDLEARLGEAQAQAEAWRARAEQAEARTRTLQEAAESELRSTRLRLDAAHRRYAPLTDLSPGAIRVARELAGISRRYPRMARAVKAVARRGARLWKW